MEREVGKEGKYLYPFWDDDYSLGTIYLKHEPIVHAKNICILKFIVQGSKRVCVQNILSEGNLNRGYGTVAFRALIKLSIYNQFEEIFGKIQSDPPAYNIQLRHFFRKNFCEVSDHNFFLKLTHPNEIFLKIKNQQLLEENRYLTSTIERRETELQQVNFELRELKVKLKEAFERKNKEHISLSKLFHRFSK
ncbi:hypothetical protein [Virgibacillus salexigens]|uniref:hypothetical protein n=1 Tax=Virgibacillus massiliensis TaxID=1462526 RepID=UPI00136C9E33|nr:hypothetical protein [Virgibacillus massiliensis]MYL43625.1 hypothetical protein [Virgibacillus massiliensis]